MCFSLKLRDEPSDLGEVVSTEYLRTIFLDDLAEEQYSAIKVHATRDPDLDLEEVMIMMKTIFINQSERLSVPKRSQELYCKGYNSGRGSTMRENGRESAMTITVKQLKKAWA